MQFLFGIIVTVSLVMMGAKLVEINQIVGQLVMDNKTLRSQPAEQSKLDKHIIDEMKEMVDALKTSRQREDMLAKAIKSVQYEADVLTSAIKDSYEERTLRPVPVK